MSGLVRTMRLLSVDESFICWANWGAHAEYAYCQTSLTRPDIAILIDPYVGTTSESDQCRCYDGDNPPGFMPRIRHYARRGAAAPMTVRLILVYHTRGEAMKRMAVDKLPTKTR
jgi:hypothetical protein